MKTINKEAVTDISSAVAHTCKTLNQKAVSGEASVQEMKLIMETAEKMGLQYPKGEENPLAESMDMINMAKDKFALEDNIPINPMILN